MGSLFTKQLESELTKSVETGIRKKLCRYSNSAASKSINFNSFVKVRIDRVIHLDDYRIERLLNLFFGWEG